MAPSPPTTIVVASNEPNATYSSGAKLTPPSLLRRSLRSIGVCVPSSVLLHHHTIKPSGELATPTRAPIALFEPSIVPISTGSSQDAPPFTDRRNKTESI